MAKKNSRAKGASWLMPLLFALPVAVGVTAALLLWGDKLRDLINIAVKVAVIV